MSRSGRRVAELRDWLRFASPDAEVTVVVPQRLLDAEVPSEDSLAVRAFAQLGSRCELAIEGGRLPVELEAVAGEARATRLARENQLVVQVSRALLGSVSENLRCVTIEVVLEGALVHFLLARDLAEDREEIAEVMFDLENLCSGLEECRAVVHVSSVPDSLKSLPGRWVYARKES